MKMPEGCCLISRDTHRKLGTYYVFFFGEERMLRQRSQNAIRQIAKRKNPLSQGGMYVPTFYFENYWDAYRFFMTGNPLPWSNLPWGKEFEA